MANETEIARLEAILNGGATDVSTDGVRVVTDHASIRRRLAELKRMDDVSRRPVVSQIDLSGF
jgi:hypothetical protein